MRCANAHEAVKQGVTGITCFVLKYDGLVTNFATKYFQILLSIEMHIRLRQFPEIRQ